MDIKRHQKGKKMQSEKLGTNSQIQEREKIDTENKFCVISVLELFSADFEIIEIHMLNKIDDKMENFTRQWNLD